MKNMKTNLKRWVVKCREEEAKKREEKKRKGYYMAKDMQYRVNKGLLFRSQERCVECWLC